MRCGTHHPCSVLTLVSALVSVTLSLPNVAHAQDDLEQAKELFKRGEKLYQREDFRGAAAAFTEAYELSNRDELLYYMGKSWEALGDLIQARSCYQRYLNNVPDADNAETILDTVIALQGRINKEMGRVTLVGHAEESPIFVDAEKEPRCLAPCTVAIGPDSLHTIRVVDESGRSISREFTVAAGETAEFARAAEPSSDRGTLLVTSDVSSASLRVDADPQALGTPLMLPSGRHHVTLRHDATAWEGEVEIAADETTSLMIPMAHLDTQPRDGISLRRVGAYSLLSVGAGLLIGGALMGRQANSTFNTLDQRQSQGLTPDTSMIDQGRTQQRAANLLFLSGGLALATGGGLFTWELLSADKGPSPTPSQDSAQPPEPELDAPQ